MGIVGFLQFSLKCVDLFAWPIFALAYPLFASIRAIETNSNSHMRKLVTYWILFSLISLFEHTFAKFIEWIIPNLLYITSLANFRISFPLWAYIKIVAICWLVRPRFGHAYQVYKSLVPMCSYVNLQVKNWSNKQGKEHFLKTEDTFLSVAEKFIKENGSEALEELIANKLAKPNLGAKENMAVTITVKKEMPTTIESKGAKPDVEEIKAPANTEKKEKATKIKSEGAKPNLDAEEIKVANAEKEEMAAIEVKRAKENLVETGRRKAEVVEVKEMNYCPSFSDKFQTQWTCAVCHVTTSNQTTLYSHFQGKKHLAKCQKLKKMAVTITEKKEMATTIESKGAKPDVEEIKALANTEKKEKATKIKSEGAKPNLDAEEIKVANAEKEEMAAIEVKRAKENLVETERRKAEVVEVKEMNYCPSSSDKFQTQWTCAVCHVTTSSQTTLDSHFQGKKHLANRQKLEKMAVTNTEKKEMATTIESKGAKPDVEEIKAPASTEKKEKATKIKSEGAKPNLDAEEIKVANAENEEMAAIEVKRAKENLVETERRKAEVVEVKEMNYCPSSSDKFQTQWTCAVCQVTTSSQTTLDSHFQGKKHLAKRQKLEKMAVTNTEKKEMATTIESKGAKPDVEEIKAPASTEKKEKATKIKSEGAKPNLDAEEIKVANAEKEEMAAIEVKRAKENLVETERRKAEVVEVKEMNYCPSSSDKFQTQWTCAVCHVTTSSQTTLDSHFQGKKHLANCRKLEAKKQTPKNNCSSSSLTTMV